MIRADGRNAVLVHSVKYDEWAAVHDQVRSVIAPRPCLNCRGRSSV